MNPKKAAELIFDKLAMAKVIGKQNRTRAVGIIEFQLRAFYKTLQSAMLF